MSHRERFEMCALSQVDGRLWHLKLNEGPLVWWNSGIMGERLEVSQITSVYLNVVNCLYSLLSSMPVYIFTTSVVAYCWLRCFHVLYLNYSSRPT